MPLPYVETMAGYFGKEPSQFEALWGRCRQAVRAESESESELEGSREFVRTVLAFRARLKVDRPVYLDQVIADGGPEPYTPVTADTVPLPSLLGEEASTFRRAGRIRDVSFGCIPRLQRRGVEQDKEE